jgi:hypothetical protein
MDIVSIIQIQLDYLSYQSRPAFPFSQLGHKVADTIEHEEGIRIQGQACSSSESAAGISLHNIRINAMTPLGLLVIRIQLNALFGIGDSLSQSVFETREFQGVDPPIEAAQYGPDLTTFRLNAGLML